MRKIIELPILGVGVENKLKVEGYLRTIGLCVKAGQPYVSFLIDTELTTSLTEKYVIFSCDDDIPDDLNLYCKGNFTSNNTVFYVFISWSKDQLRGML